MFSYACDVLGLALVVVIGYVLIRDPRAFAGSTIALVAAVLVLFFGNLDRINRHSPDEHPILRSEIDLESVM